MLNSELYYIMLPLLIKKIVIFALRLEGNGEVPNLTNSEFFI